jgi:hypothetical protein
MGRLTSAPQRHALALSCRQQGWQHGFLALHRLTESEMKGSVRSRASQYRLNWNEANPGSCRLQDGQHDHGPPEVEESAAIGGNVLVVAGVRAEEVAQFIVSATEPSG